MVLGQERVNVGAGRSDEVNGRPILPFFVVWYDMVWFTRNRPKRRKASEASALFAISHQLRINCLGKGSKQAAAAAVFPLRGLLTAVHGIDSLWAHNLVASCKFYPNAACELCILKEPA